MSHFTSDMRGLILGICVVLACGYGVDSRAADACPQIYDLTYQPSPFHVGTGIEVVPRLLHESADTVQYHCRWFVNEQEVDGENGTLLSGDYFQRGDMIAVEVTAGKGECRGGAVESGRVEVANAPPEIVSQPPQQVVEGKFEYRLEARDADGDDLSVSLAKAPEGMRLDADSGTLTWQVKPWTRGNFAVSVLVEDGHGGEASQAFALNLDYAEDDGALHE